ncbi:MAG: ABC transporter ATP-binding protein [Clostridia bacterium]
MIVKCTDLCKAYGKKNVLDGLTFCIEENSITGLIGRNGSGKTTLMKILNGTLPKTSGETLVLGQEPVNNIDVLKNMVYSIHNYPYEENLKLKYILKIYEEMFENFDMDFAKKLLDFFKLEEKMRYKALSLGMKSMFNFSVALATRSKITMLDEPVLGMDAAVRKDMYDILLRDYYENPRTFIISSHLLNELETVLSDILLIGDNKVILHDNIDNIRGMAYRVDGDIRSLEKFAYGKEILSKRQGEVQTYMIIKERINEEVKRKASEFDIKVSTLRAEEICIYLTGQEKEADLECLWTDKN